MALTRLKLRCCQGCSPFWGLSGQCFLAFSGFERQPIILGSRPLPPASGPGKLHHSDSSSMVTPSSNSANWERFSSLKDPCDYVGPIRMILDNLPIIRNSCRSYNLNHICKVPLGICGNTSIGSRGLGGGHLWGAIFLPSVWRDSRKMPLNGADHRFLPYPPRPALPCNTFSYSLEAFNSTHVNCPRKGE